VAGESLVESRQDRHPGHHSVVDRAVEYQLEPGRDLEKPTGSLAIALIDPDAEPGPGSLLASALRESANNLDRAVQAGDWSHSVDTQDRNTGCTASHRRGAFQPVQGVHPKTFDARVAAFPLTRRPLVDSEGTILGLESAPGSIEAQRSGSLAQPALRSLGSSWSILAGPIESLVAAAISSQATLLELEFLAGPS
jgi:hypothetical protein